MKGQRKQLPSCLDGETKVVKTHANTVDDFLKELEITVKARRLYSPSKNSLK